ncbi:MAG: hypothetical protein G01um101413_691 [Parcubacteria group bacterium Gr01-1014_13]|nr:MAG: hypothetical protein G01um101413_691 [Parcubacteria group bacterium Gr01-1014_13]
MAKRDKKRRRRKPPAKKSQSALPTKGNHHDLLEIFNAINLWYFDGKIKARISWGRRVPFPPRYHKTMSMAHCHVENRLIIISRSLDRSSVPRLIVEYTVFHEILHLKFPPRIKNGRHNFHYKEFCDAEKQFANYAEAEEWEKNHNYLLHFF